MMLTAALIGYGEAGQAFDADGTCLAFDILPERTKTATLAQALVGADVVLCLVTADQALAAATSAAAHMAKGAVFCDMNSVAPATKQAAARVIEAAGGRYIDVAVMSPVHPARRATPLLVSGAEAAAGQAALLALGFSNVRVVGDAVGRASTIKMLRSVIYKGMEALTAECLLACEKAGVTDEVLASLGGDWASAADYRLDRMMIHGERRAAEMAEVVKTLDGLGIAPLMTRGTVVWQAEIGGQGVKTPPEGLTAKLERLQA